MGLGLRVLGLRVEGAFVSEGSGILGIEGGGAKS